MFTNYEKTGFLLVSRIKSMRNSKGQKIEGVFFDSESPCLVSEEDIQTNPTFKGNENVLIPADLWSRIRKRAKEEEKRQEIIPELQEFRDWFNLELEKLVSSFNSKMDEILFQLLNHKKISEFVESFSDGLFNDDNELQSALVEAIKELGEPLPPIPDCFGEEIKKQTKEFLSKVQKDLNELQFVFPPFIYEKTSWVNCMESKTSFCFSDRAISIDRVLGSAALFSGVDGTLIKRHFDGRVIWKKSFEKAEASSPAVQFPLNVVACQPPTVLPSRMVFAYSSYQNKSLRICESDSGNVISELKLCGFPVSLKWVSQGLLLIGLHDGLIQGFRTQGSQLTRGFRAVDGFANCLAGMEEESNLCFVGSDKGNLVQVNYSTSLVTQTHKAYHKDRIVMMSYSCENKKLATASDDGLITVFANGRGLVWSYKMAGKAWGSVWVRTKSSGMAVLGFCMSSSEVLLLGETNGSVLSRFLLGFGGIVSASFSFSNKCAIIGHLKGQTTILGIE